jgi:hypothetical protein
MFLTVKPPSKAESKEAAAYVQVTQVKIEKLRP